MKMQLLEMSMAYINQCLNALEAHKLRIKCKNIIEIKVLSEEETAKSPKNGFE